MSANLSVILPSAIALLSIIVNIIQFMISRKDSKNIKLEDEIKVLMKENDDLKYQLDVRNSIFLSDGITYYKNADNNTPICPICYGKNHIPIPMVSQDYQGKYWKCSACDYRADDTSIEDNERDY